MHHTVIDLINLFTCSSSQNRSTHQQTDPRTLPDQPSISSNRVADGAFQSSVGQHGMLHSSVDSSCFTNWTSSTSSILVARMTHPRSNVQRPSTCPLLASVPPRLPQPMTNSQVSALCPRQLARHVHAVSSCTLARLTERSVSALAAHSIVACSQHFSSGISHETQRPRLQHQRALLPIKLLRLTRVAVRLPWSSYLCLRLLYPQTAVDASAAPHLVFPAWFLCRTRVTRFETAVMTRGDSCELIFGIQLHFFTWFLQSSFLEISPPALPRVAVSSPFCLVAWSPQPQRCSSLASDFSLIQSSLSCGPDPSALSLSCVLWPSSFSKPCHLAREPLVLYHLAWFD